MHIPKEFEIRVGNEIRISKMEKWIYLIIQ